MIPRSFILSQTKTFSDCNTKHRKALNTQRFQTKTQRFQSQCGQVFPHSDFKQNYSAKRQRGQAFPPAISNKNYSAIQKTKWTGFFHQHFQQNYSAIPKTMWTGFSTSDFKQKLLSNSKENVDRFFFPPAISNKITQQFQGQVDRFFHAEIWSNILSVFKSTWTGSSTQRFQAKNTQRFQGQADRFFHAEISSKILPITSREETYNFFLLPDRRGGKTPLRLQHSFLFSSRASAQKRTQAPCQRENNVMVKNFLPEGKPKYRIGL